MPSSRSMLVALTTLLAAGSAGATVTVNHSSTAYVGSLSIGAVFDVSVRLVWDGQGALQEVTSSTSFDSTIVQFISAASPASSVLAYAGDPVDPNDDVPGLDRLGGVVQSGDPVNVLRTVQYGGTAPVSPLAATTPAGRLITTLRFRLIAVGVTSIGTVIAMGDTGAVGDTFSPGTTVAVGWVPEPGTALLLGVGLTFLSLRRSCENPRSTSV